jgi:hypothetical protein
MTFCTGLRSMRPPANMLATVMLMPQPAAMVAIQTALPNTVKAMSGMVTPRDSMPNL